MFCGIRVYAGRPGKCAQKLWITEEQSSHWSGWKCGEILMNSAQLGVRLSTSITVREEDLERGSLFRGFFITYKKKHKLG